MKIFGKEPAFFVGVIEAVILVLVTFGLPHDAAAVIATLTVAVGGVLTAIAAKDTLLAALVALAKAVIVLVVFLGYNISDESTAAIIGLLTLFLGGYLRTQTSSTDTPISAQSDGLKRTTFATGGLVPGDSDNLARRLLREDPGRR